MDTMLLAKKVVEIVGALVLMLSILAPLSLVLWVIAEDTSHDG